MTPLEGSEPPTQLTGLAAGMIDTPVAWAADGRQVLFVSSESRGPCIDFFDECYTLSDLFAVAVDPPYQVRRLTWFGDVSGAWVRPRLPAIAP